MSTLMSTLTVRKLDIDLAWRLRWYVYVLVLFTLDASRQTVLNLWRDGTLFKPSTWVHALRFFLGRKGAVWLCAKPLAAYFRRDFHPDYEIEPPAKPSAQDLASQWLKAHAARFRVIR
jgi:predicted metal-dependent hydrolase